MIKYVIYIGVVLLSLICTEVNAQNRDFGGLNRYAQENKNVPKIKAGCLYGKLHHRRVGERTS